MSHCRPLQPGVQKLREEDGVKTVQKETESKKEREKETVKRRTRNKEVFSYSINVIGTVEMSVKDLILYFLSQWMTVVIQISSRMSQLKRSPHMQLNNIWHL